MQITKIKFTKEGYEVFKEDYEELLRQRPDAVENLKKARELGDLKENGYYKASRAKLSFIDSRLQRIKSILKNSVIIKPQSVEVVSFGSKVTLNYGKTYKEYRIVSKFEADPSAGKVSDVSPIGKALMGKKLGDSFEINVPAGIVTYQVVKISV